MIWNVGRMVSKFAPKLSMWWRVKRLSQHLDQVESGQMMAGGDECKVIPFWKLNQARAHTVNDRALWTVRKRRGGNGN